MRPKGMKASEYLKRRNELVTFLSELDEQITQVLNFGNSKRAANRARELFDMRHRVGERLLMFGIEIDDHPALDMEPKNGNQIEN